MPKIHLTIDPNYCQDWKFFEGVREFLQNAKDAEEHDGREMSIEHKARSATLVITTKNISISASDLLLLGKTSKGAGNQRGKFGEGFALGCLALVRARHPVTIYNGDSKWRPEICRAEEGPFIGSEVLTINTRQLPGSREDFSIEIENVSNEVWEATKKLFLFLAPPKQADVVTVSEGRVLLGEAYQGMVYAQGIFVMHSLELECGYDLNSVQLDRDRRMVNEWDLTYKLGQIWQLAVNQNPSLLSRRVYEMAKKDRKEVKYLHYYLDDKLAKSLRDEFQKEHGKDTIPVTNMEDAQEFLGLGAPVSIVSTTLQQLLTHNGPNISDMKDKFRGKVMCYTQPAELTEREKAACAVLVAPITRVYAIVEFNDMTRCRLHSDEKTVLIARALLAENAASILSVVAGVEAKRAGVSVESILIDVIAKQWDATPVGVAATTVAYKSD